MDDRQGIDPAGRYPSVRHPELERWAREAFERLPGAQVSRTEDAIQLDWGGAAGIIVIFTPEAMELRLPTIEWIGGAYGPMPSSSLWRRVPLHELTEEHLPVLLDACKAARAAEFAACKYCGKRFPPERRHSEDVCHGCASEYEGVVY